MTGGRLNGLGDKPHTVYLHRNAADEIIYVGVTSDLPARNRQHSARAAHWPEVAAIEVDSVQPDYIAGRLREARLIREHKPKHNRYQGFVELWEARQLRARMTDEELAERRAGAMDAVGRLHIGAAS